MRNTRSPLALAAILAGALLAPGLAAAQCGTELWSIKTGTDADAGSVSLSSAKGTSIGFLASQRAPAENPGRRRASPVETTLWSLDCTLKMAKRETDSDYHLVLIDSTGQTMIGEIPSPQCVGGGSPFASGISRARAQFDQHWSLLDQQVQQFIQINVPVRITGVGFFDRPHGQAGVAPNAVEIHPVLDIEVLGAARPGQAPQGGSLQPPVPAAPPHSNGPIPPAPPAAGRQPSGQQPASQQPVDQSPKHVLRHIRRPSRQVAQLPWEPGQVVHHASPHGASAGVLDSADQQAAHEGDFQAWLGGHGHEHHDEVAATVQIPAGVKKATLTFWLHIFTYDSGDQAKDTLVVRVKDAQGFVLRPLASYSNLDQCADYQQRTFDVTDLAGQTVDISMEADEAGGPQTSFLVDDVELVTQ